MARSDLAWRQAVAGDDEQRWRKVYMVGSELESIASSGRRRKGRESLGVALYDLEEVRLRPGKGNFEGES
ncbi:hypothetical protein E2562_038693 [Oryza meyeriana var. granulata]|uniref:Uncharacterized protein n=1 Tax=Oryza meyeriana var. granulata TaxID=110450 RepID=A0A6G1CWP7_9ORYZ|nr:hypothetical protein E2562_038693 [Oryza meyeriana var. granulata]